MKRILNYLLLAVVILVGQLFPGTASAAGISPSGGGTYTVGQNFTVRVTASGAEFDSLQGQINVSGPVSVVSFAAGSATWLPGKSPASGKQFVGITSPTKNLTVATITLKGTGAGKGSVTVSGVQLARSGNYVGQSGGTASFTIGRAPTPPGQVSVSSPTHPDQNQTYEATTLQLAWEPPANGASGYSAVFDQSAETTPEQKVTTTEKTATYDKLTVGIHYFHIRAQNGDGWSAPTHFKVTIKETTDSSLAVPVITTVTTSSDVANNIEEGTVTGIILGGTGPVGYKIALVFTPDLGFPADRYPPPAVGENGRWELTIVDPLKAGFYKVTAQAKNETTASAVSAAVAFEVQVADGGQVRLITKDDKTDVFKAAEATRVLAAKKRVKIVSGSVAGLVLIGGALAAWYFWRRRLLARKN